jgi:general secretion pathway protein F
MPKFRYTAVKELSESVEGYMDAASKFAVINRLHASGHTPIRVDEVGISAIAGIDVAELFRSRRISHTTLALITRQLAMLLRAGLALDEALRILAELVDRKHEKECLQSLLERISGGTTLADAMAAQTKVFPEFYISMVRAGEVGASLEAVLGRLAEFLERSLASKETIRSALLYPLVVAFVCCSSIAILFAFVIPRFRPVFEQAGDALPSSTRMLLAVSDFINDFWWAGLLSIVLVVIAARWHFSDPVRRQQWDRLSLRIPLFGELIRKIEVVHFARTLGTLLKNGVSLLQALTITRETIRNRIFIEAIDTVIDHVKSGKGLAEPLNQTKAFPPLAVHLIRVGEEAGRQEEMLLDIADIFETETRRTINRMLTLLGPVLTVGMGVVVAGVIGSILTAVLSVYDLAV